jgi:hypothetical protein
MADYTLCALYNTSNHGKDCLSNISQLQILFGTYGAPPGPLYETGLKRMAEIGFLVKFLPKTKAWWIGTDRTTPVVRWVVCFEFSEILRSERKGTICLRR